jgi:hypothetical protein
MASQNHFRAHKMAGPEPYEGTLAFDNLDIDLILKVASHTIFGPFFTFFVPIIYKGMGAPWTAPTVFYSSAWFLFVTSICTLLAPPAESGFAFLTTLTGRAAPKAFEQVSKQRHTWSAQLGGSNRSDHWGIIRDWVLACEYTRHSTGDGRRLGCHPN